MVAFPEEHPGLSIGHISPEAADGGAIGLVRDGDMIQIDIPARTIDVLLKRRNWKREGGGKRTEWMETQEGQESFQSTEDICQHGNICGYGEL